MANQTQILNVSDEMKLNDNVQMKNVKEQEENMYSSSSDTTEELCSSSTTDACGVYSVYTKNRRQRYMLRVLQNWQKRNKNYLVYIFRCIVKEVNMNILTGERLHHLEKQYWMNMIRMLCLK